MQVPVANYMSQVTGIRKISTVADDVNYRIMLIYPFISDEKLPRPMVELARDFYAINCIKRVVLDNAINIVKLGGLVEPVVMKMDNIYTSTGAYPTTKLRHEEDVVPRGYVFDIQQRIDNVSQVLVKYVTSDPVISQFRPILDRIFLNNLIQVPLIVGTALRQYHSALISLLFTAVALSGARFDNLNLKNNIDVVDRVMEELVGYTIQRADSDTGQIGRRNRQSGTFDFVRSVATNIRRTFGANEQDMRRIYRLDKIRSFLKFINDIITGEFARQYGWGSNIRYDDYVASSLSSGMLNRFIQEATSSAYVRYRNTFDIYLGNMIRSAISLFIPLPPIPGYENVAQEIAKNIDSALLGEDVTLRMENIFREVIDKFSTLPEGQQDKFLDDVLRDECSEKYVIDFNYPTITEVSPLDKKHEFISRVLEDIRTSMSSVVRSFIGVCNQVKGANITSHMDALRGFILIAVQKSIQGLVNLYSQFLQSSNIVPSYVYGSNRSVSLNEIMRLLDQVSQSLADIILGKIVIEMRQELCKLLNRATIELNLSQVSAADPINCVFVIDLNTLQFCYSVIATHWSGEARGIDLSKYASRATQNVRKIGDELRTDISSVKTLMHQPHRVVRNICDSLGIPNLIVITDNQFVYKLFFERDARTLDIGSVQSFVKSNLEGR